MTRHKTGYGRYDDDLEHVGCPYADSDMTPCIARDGHIALADTNVCVGCGHTPMRHLKELKEQGVGVKILDLRTLRPSIATQADALRDLVRQITEPEREKKP